MGTKPKLNPSPPVTSFPILCFVPIFLFPVPLARSRLPVPRFSNIRVKTSLFMNPAFYLHFLKFHIIQVECL